MPRIFYTLKEFEDSGQWVLKEWDTVYIHKVGYRVRRSYLDTVSFRQSNDEVFKVLNIQDRHAFASASYWYRSRPWIWPEYKADDYEAATRIYKDLCNHKAVFPKLDTRVVIIDLHSKGKTTLSSRYSKVSTYNTCYLNKLATLTEAIHKMILPFNTYATISLIGGLDLPQMNRTLHSFDRYMILIWWEPGKILWSYNCASKINVVNSVMKYLHGKPKIKIIPAEDIINDARKWFTDIYSHLWLEVEKNLEYIFWPSAK